MTGTARRKVLTAVIVPPHLVDSGAVRAAIDLSVALAAEHCDVDIALMSTSSGESQMEKARLLRLRCRNPMGFTRGILPNRFRTLFYRANIDAVIDTGDYDLVHVHNIMPALQMRRTVRSSVQHGVPCVVSTHGIVEAASGLTSYGFSSAPVRFAWNRFVERPLREALHGADGIVTLSSGDLPALRYFGVEDKVLGDVPNAVSESFVVQVEASQQATVLGQIGLDEGTIVGRPVAFFLANHAVNKGINVLLEAFDQCRSPYVLVVGGQRRDHVDYARWERRRRDGQHIVFTDNIPLPHVQALYSRADLFVFPTFADTFPMVILEAMAYGCAIVSTPVGGIPHQVNDECAVLVPPGDARELSRVLDGLLADANRMSRMGAAAAGAGERFVGWSESAQRAMTAYDKALAART